MGCGLGGWWWVVGWVGGGKVDETEKGRMEMEADENCIDCIAEQERKVGCHQTLTKHEVLIRQADCSHT